jgi:hypothetical protein
MQLLDDIKETRGYCKLKEEVLDGTAWRTCFGRGYGPFVRLRNESAGGYIRFLRDVILC